MSCFWFRLLHCLLLYKIWPANWEIVILLCSWCMYQFLIYWWFFIKNWKPFLSVKCISSMSGDTFKIFLLISANMSNYINEQYNIEGCLYYYILLCFEYWFRNFLLQYSQVRINFYFFFVTFLSGLLFALKIILKFSFYLFIFAVVWNNLQ